ncbi:hypothetical protein F2Q69_00005472 [Brassica cretica]|uniref:Uncharacterized protein n=2 Tax=Brassica cretica TaxID=69181 RepID=A0A8S9NYZ4_BRACR|nr:hypothetical protein F2Q69_00005472 [Brassica cretica]
MHGYAHICLPEHAEKFTRTMLVPDTYSRAEIDDMVHGIYRAHEMSLDDSYKRLDDVYYPINDSIDRLTERMDMLKEEIYMIRRQTAIQSEASIDTSHASLRRRMVTVKLLEDKLDEINFCQDRMKEDFSHRPEDISESTHARLGKQQHNISIGEFMALVQRQPEANTDPMIMEQLQNKDERIEALETQNATILAELADQKKTNNEIIDKMKRLFPDEFQ